MPAAQIVASVLAAGFLLDDCRRITPGLLYDVLQVRMPEQKDNEADI